MIDMWLARQTAEKVLPRIQKVLDAVKDEYADCISHSGGIYAAGYCFGAKYVLILAGEHPDSVLHGQHTGDEEQGMVKKAPIIKAGAIAHATLVTREDVKAVKAPMSIVAVENDPLFPDEIIGCWQETSRQQCGGRMRSRSTRMCRMALRSWGSTQRRISRMSRRRLLSRWWAG